MTAAVLPNAAVQSTFDSDYALASVYALTMAQPPYINWAGELTLSAHNAPSVHSGQTTPPIPQVQRSGSVYGYEEPGSAGGHGEGQFALPYSAGSDSGKSASPLDRLGFAKFLSGEKKTRGWSSSTVIIELELTWNIDGQPPKRRGPKPDSKPALTRRQELNRQAQRTHRERKEMYIKALEAEVLRLKEVYSDTSRERDTMAREREAMVQEIQRLKNLLAAHGISDESAHMAQTFQRTESAYHGSSSASHAGSSYNPGTASTGYTSPPQMAGTSAGSPPTQQARASNQRLDYDQIGIDFVLALEHPCMDHMQFLMVRSQESDEGEISGHALMATCPPESYVAEHPKEPYGHKMPDIGMTDLVKLLDLSNRLPLDGEITPIMAWAGIHSHPRRDQLTKDDFDKLKHDLTAKVRCYGFGAVLEEFEVRDAMTAVFAPKDHTSPDAVVQESEMNYTFGNAGNVLQQGTEGLEQSNSDGQVTT
ncbi:hypothetical protein NA57DRAFT_55712 [Rhizodiscina lignyota]|uniref:BZIP domain-containing protein n=1 Tax=Rhizodiscina lignyota TaxID=1504668 RepID=A0A9P4IDU1_9PEZI|nr:hypothetical protein NA57DRAFT_55712 [Rhizodiscina lignyota]